MNDIIKKNRLKIFVSLLLIAAIFIFAANIESKATILEQGEKDKLFEVTVQKAQDSKEKVGVLKYPATVVGDQEIKIVSQISGTAEIVDFDLGDQVSFGRVLARIEDQGTLLNDGKNNFSSAQILQAEIDLKKAKESLDLAKENYDDEKSEENKSAKDIAKLEYESAKIALQSAMNSRIITAPISGIITSRNISSGDSVSQGQTIATISKNKKIKAQFFVSKEDILNFSLGNQVKIIDDGREFTGKIVNISPQAENSTKKFLIEVSPISETDLLFGTIVEVQTESRKRVEQDGNFILPLSAISTAQNASHIFIVENGSSKKTKIEVLEIFGENAVVRADISDDAEIVIDGNKMIQDGDKVKIK